MINQSNIQQKLMQEIIDQHVEQAKELERFNWGIDLYSVPERTDELVPVEGIFQKLANREYR